MGEELPVSAQKVVMFCDKLLTNVRCLEQDMAELKLEIEIMRRAGQNVIDRAKIKGGV